MYAPIVVFAFNRLDSLRGTIESLLANTEARESHLFVFVDGPRKEKESEQEKVAKVREYVKSIRGFQAIDYSFHETNQGLGPSIIEGVSKVFSKYGEAIVLEDDLIVSSNFLSFMNQGLDKYWNESQVFSICGYSNKVNVPTGYQADAYFCPRSSSWGWATWKRFVDMWDPQYKFLENNESITLLEKSGDLTEKRLTSYYKHKATGREHYEDFVSSTRIFNSMLAIIPSKNLISNIGISSVSTHSVDNLTMLPPKIRKLYYQPTYEYKFPLKHPLQLKYFLGYKHI